MMRCGDFENKINNQLRLVLADLNDKMILEKHKCFLLPIGDDLKFKSEFLFFWLLLDEKPTLLNHYI